MQEIILFDSGSFDPWYNLAVEEMLLDTVGENQCLLYLWQNQNTVVIGKNQNPWKECQTAVLEREGGYLARRLSGGGAVFHDLGNLNFTFLMNRAGYNLQKQLGVILAAVKELGIPAEINGRNDLIAGGRKFSGNAFCFRKNNALHHGTILISSNLRKLVKYLKDTEEKIRTKGVESVRSRVVNLSEFYPPLTVAMVKEALYRQFIRVYGEKRLDSLPEVRSAGSLDQSSVQKIYQKYASWEWRYGEAPKFDLEISTRFEWGRIEIEMKLEAGIIREAVVYSDTGDGSFISGLSQALIGKTLNAPLIAEGILYMDAGPDKRRMQKDVARWILAKGF